MLLHFIWQGFAVAALLASVRVAFKDPRLRYATACAALLAMVVLPLFSLLTNDSGSHRPGPGALGIYLRDAQLVEEVPTSPAVPTLESVLPLSLENIPGGWVASLTAALQGHIFEIVLCWAVGVLLLSLRLVGGCWIPIAYSIRGPVPSRMSGGCACITWRREWRQAYCQDQM